MITKLTLTIEEDVIQYAKKYAKENGKSLSGVVENYLKTLSSSSGQYDAKQQKTKNLRGVIKLPKNYDYKKELGHAITKKFIK